ncbi:unnamed protein product [marine sediment metagenome]|uniref:Uncharacterized protein n=1 Tax=marine sediment metagenome TaxID=412755 RepID=X0TWT0_9ZZZZ
MYACLKCGKIHSGKLSIEIRHQEASRGSGPGPGGFRVEGYPEAWFKESYFVCTNCNQKQVVISEKQKEV